MTTAYLNRIATATPPHDVHHAFISFAETLVPEGTERNLFRRMVRMSQIEHRYSFIEPQIAEDGKWKDAEGIYVPGNFPGTAPRMQAFERFAPQLARCALKRLALTPNERQSITHIIVTSCTGLYAPGLDFDVVDALELTQPVERTMIGFMGCYAAINALKSARHIIRSQPDACVLLLNLELCSLHMQETPELEQVLSFLLFADGCAASLVTARETGLALDSFLALRLPETSHLITWKIREMGFDMQLSGQVPAEIRRTLGELGAQITMGRDPGAIDLWAIHPGGRTILDAVEKGLALAPDALTESRRVLANYGNMSSASVMFVLRELIERAQPGQQGCAMSFGPGVTAETMLFHAA